MKKRKNKKNKNIIAIENCVFFLKLERINSPHSLKALSILGINEEELYKLSSKNLKMNI